MSNNKLKIPKQIKIGQRIFTIEVTDELNKGNDLYTYGFINIVHDIIVVASFLDEPRMRSTLLHEIMHAIFKVNHNGSLIVPPKQDDETYDEYRDRWEHYSIFSMDENLLTVLRDNPELVEFLTK